MSYIRLNNNFFNRSETADLMQDIKWYSIPNQETIDGPVKLHNVPESIQKSFNYENIYISAGFVKVNSNYNLPPHEDNFLASFLEPHRDVLGDYYIDWLSKTGSRKCSLMIPISGDFSNTHTDLYWKDTMKKFASFTLEEGPVLFQTCGEVLHGVDNRNKNERITFQLSFGENYEYVRDKILALGLAKV